MNKWSHKQKEPNNPTIATKLTHNTTTVQMKTLNCRILQNQAHHLTNFAINFGIPCQQIEKSYFFFSANVHYVGHWHQAKPMGIFRMTFSDCAYTDSITDISKLGIPIRDNYLNCSFPNAKLYDIDLKRFLAMMM